MTQNIPRFRYYLGNRNKFMRFESNSYTKVQKQPGQPGEHIYEVEWSTASVRTIFEWSNNKWNKIGKTHDQAANG